MLTRRTRVIAASPRRANQGRSGRVKLHRAPLNANRVDGDGSLRPGATPRLALVRANSFCQDQSTKIRARWPGRLAFSLGPRYQIPGTESMITERGENLLLLSAKGDVMISRSKSRRSIPAR